MRATLTTVSTVALLAAGAGSAAARPADTPMTRTTSTTQQVVTAAAPRGPHTSASRLDAANHAMAIRRLNRLDGVASIERRPLSRRQRRSCTSPASRATASTGPTPASAPA